MIIDFFKNFFKRKSPYQKIADLCLKHNIYILVFENSECMIKGIAAMKLGYMVEKFDNMPNPKDKRKWC